VKVKVTKLGFCDGLLPSIDDLRALKRLKEIACLLLDRGEWLNSLQKPPVGDERRTSMWSCAREKKASPEDRQYWAELRNLWIQLQTKFGHAIVRGKLTGTDCYPLLESWRSEYDEPECLHARIHEALERSQTNPVQLDFAGFWVFKNNRYSIQGPYGIEEQKLLVLEEFDAERRHFERLHHKHRSTGSDSSQPSRPRVPEAVRIAVWRRDGGRCSRCGSRENLEYDHIVPLAKGGSNTARNVELLCEKCNRSKADKIE
jgi:hypothetical protein